MSEAYLKEIQLPSLGNLYDGQLPGGYVSLEPLGTKEEKLFSSGSLQAGEIINKIFDASVHCEIDHRDLILGDRTFILMQLRSISYGNIYEYSFKCSECGAKSWGSLDFDKLPLILPDPQIDDPSRFSVKLPLREDELQLRLLTGRDEDKIRRYMKQIKSKTKGKAANTGYIYRLARRLLTINGSEVGVREAMEYVEGLKGRDSLAIRDAVLDHDIGPDLTVEPTCDNCGMESDPFPMPFSTEFFRPRRRSSKSRDDLRTAEALDAS